MARSAGRSKHHRQRWATDTENSKRRVSWSNPALCLRISAWGISIPRTQQSQSLQGQIQGPHFRAMGKGFGKYNIRGSRKQNRPREVRPQERTRLVERWRHDCCRDRRVPEDERVDHPPRVHFVFTCEERCAVIRLGEPKEWPPKSALPYSVEE